MKFPCSILIHHQLSIHPVSVPELGSDDALTSPQANKAIIGVKTNKCVCSQCVGSMEHCPDTGLTGSPTGSLTGRLGSSQLTGAAIYGERETGTPSDAACLCLLRRCL